MPNKWSFNTNFKLCKLRYEFELTKSNNMGRTNKI